MKKYFILPLLFISSVAIGQTNKNVVIHGELKGDLKGYNKIYLYTRMSNDSAEIVNGKYTFSFPFVETDFKTLYPEFVKEMKQMYQPFGILITEPGDYFVTSDMAEGLSTSSEVRGPKSMELYRKFELDQNEAYKKMNTAKINILGKDWYKVNEEDAAYEQVQKTNDSLYGVFVVPILEKLLKENPDNEASAYVLSGAGRNIQSMEEKESLLSLLSPRMQKSEKGKKFSDYIQGLKSSNVGSKVANFILPDPQGKPVDFKSMKGKYVLIDFWASWCAPCRKSFPHMREVYKTFKSKDFEIYSISIDENKKAWLKAVVDEANPWPQSLDDKNINQSGFAVTGVPSTFLIDPQGKIILKEVGFDSEGNSLIEKKLEELFGKKVTKKAKEEDNKTKSKEAIPMMKMSGS